MTVARLLAWLGCASPTPPAPTSPATLPTYESGGICVAEPGVTGMGPPAAGVWLQYLIVRWDDPIVGYRIYADGRYEAYRRGEWRPGRPLDAGEIEIVRKTIERVGIPDWSSYALRPPVVSIHGPDPAITVDLWTAEGSWHRRLDDDCAFEPLHVLADTLNRTVDPLRGRP